VTWESPTADWNPEEPPAEKPGRRFLPWRWSFSSRPSPLARSWSLRWRLIALLGSLLLVGLGVSGAVTYRALHSYLLQREDLQLDSYARAAAHELITSGGFSTYGPRISSGNGGVVPFVEAVDPQGAVVASSPAVQGSRVLASPRLPAALGSVSAADAGSDPVGIARYVTVPSVASGQPPYRVRISPLSSGPLEVPGDVLVVATTLNDVDATLNAMEWTELAVVAGVLLLALLAGSWLVRRSLRPLDQMADAAGQIAAGQLDRRVPVEDPGTEVGQLGRALNGMLGRLEGAFAEKEASESRLRRFVGDASHELRTPLTSIRGYAELFRRGADRRPEDLAKAMHRIEEEATRMGFLVDDLLLLARLDQGRPLEAVPVSLGRLVSEAVDAARVVEPDRSITLEVSAGVDLDEGLMVSGDRNRLRQVVDNLLGNVRMHTPAGSAATARLSVTDRSVVLDVDDTGPGIDPSAAEKVFERFYRADLARTRDNGGAGLGLSIVYAIVGAHRGSVEAGNRPEGGARLRVTLPLAGPDPDPVPGPDAEMNASDDADGANRSFPDGPGGRRPKDPGTSQDGSSPASEEGSTIPAWSTRHPVSHSPGS
jgi:two-component system, OmpR family, sensor kinase